MSQADAVHLVPSQYPDYMGESHPERPLPPGSIVDYSGSEYPVVHDDGGGSIILDIDGDHQDIVWDLCEECLLVVSVNDSGYNPYAESQASKRPKLG